VSDELGVVVIGRNEGERLVRCLQSLSERAHRVVYVDSGSVDNSVASARRLGADTVELDTSRPFTAARGRNAGWRRLLQSAPDLEWVQFVDGDCEVRDGWLETARDYLRAHDDVGIVCGRRRERYPEASPYNRLADLEWDTPIGEAEAAGGDAMVKADALRRTDGYRESMIAGEDPEFCLRVRQLGYRVMRLDVEMTWHDSDMMHLSQWWKRTSRAGHAYMEAAFLHGGNDERYRVRQAASILAWGAALPAAALLPVAPSGGTSTGLLGAYGVLWTRVYRNSRRRGMSTEHARLYATATTVGKVAEAQGALQYIANRIRGRGSELIEYKGAESGSAED